MMGKKDKTVLSFTDVMSALLKSGLSLQDSILVCKDINCSKEMNFFCDQLISELKKGKKLYSALNSVSDKYQRIYLPLIQIGEESGNIVQVFEKLSKFLHTKQDNKHKLIQNLIYPVTVFITSIGVMLCIMFFVFPKLKSLFEVFTESSNIVADKVDKIYLSLNIIFFVVVIFLLSICVILILYRKLDDVALKIDKTLLKLPVIKDYILFNETNDFCFSMELLCAAGIPFVESLEKASASIKNRAYKKAVISCKNLVSMGNKISESFSSQEIFPSYLISWLAVGENTGKVSEVFKQVHIYYEQEYSNLISTVFSYLEPLFILITGIFVFALIGLFVIPIFSLLGML